MLSCSSKIFTTYPICFVQSIPYFLGNCKQQYNNQDEDPIHCKKYRHGSSGVRLNLSIVPLHLGFLCVVLVFFICRKVSAHFRYNLSVKSKGIQNKK